MNACTRIDRRTVADHTFDVLTLQCGDAVAELWPALGGNCVRWATANAGELLYTPDIAELVERPTRGGIPVLFPFPNRIRGGQYEWAGKHYQLPCNDSTKQNAIHGFTPRRAWRVVNHGAAASGAQATLAFSIGRDAPDCAALWPGDLELTLVWELSPGALRTRATVTNAGDGDAPFGLGFHPYFRLAGLDDRVSIAATARWELCDSLPTGKVVPADGKYDFKALRRIAGEQLDDVFTHLDATIDRSGRRPCGQLVRSDGAVVTVQAAEAFRELVAFTPPHGRAVCLEPYTCPTDAVNLAARGLDVGWHTVGSQQKWDSEVQYEIGRG